MPHVTLVSLSGLRVRDEELAELGMSLPSLSQRGSAIAQLPALGLLTLAGMLPADWSCSYHEQSRWDDEAVDRILDEKPTLVAISALTASIQDAYKLGMLLRSSGVKVVLGGLHVTVCPQEARPYCDAVVVGEGESVWLQILSDARQDRLQAEYRAGRPFDLAQSPLPRFELLGKSTRPRLTMQTQRGCPLACDFCAASRLLGTFREKPTANLRRELEAIRQIDRRPLLELADDNTFAGPRPPEELLDILAQSGARYFTEADWRIGERPEVLRSLASSGCVQVLVGIESLVFRYPGMGEKQAELDRIMDAARAIQEAGVVVNGCFIVGAEGETRQSLDRLARFILDSPLAEIQLTLQTPFPGTQLYNRLKRQGRLLEHRGWSFHTLLDVTYQPDLMSVAELEQGFRQVVGEVFSPRASRARGAIRRRVWRRNPRLSP